MFLASAFAKNVLPTLNTKAISRRALVLEPSSQAVLFSRVFPGQSSDLTGSFGWLNFWAGFFLHPTMKEMINLIPKQSRLPHRVAIDWFPKRPSRETVIEQNLGQGSDEAKPKNHQHDSLSQITPF